MQTNYSPPPTTPMEISPEEELEGMQRELKIARQVRDRLQDRLETCCQEIDKLAQFNPDNIPLQKAKAIVKELAFDDEF